MSCRSCRHELLAHAYMSCMVHADMNGLAHVCMSIRHEETQGKSVGAVREPPQPPAPVSFRPQGEISVQDRRRFLAVLGMTETLPPPLCLQPRPSDTCSTLHRWFNLCQLLFQAPFGVP
jgi:hypothetical protein